MSIYDLKSFPEIDEFINTNLLVCIKTKKFVSNKSLWICFPDYFQLK